MYAPMIRRLGLSLVVSLLACATTSASDLLKNRARWEWSLPDSKEKVTNSTFTGWVGGGLTVGKGKTEAERTKIGEWNSIGAGEIHMVISKGPLTGTIRVKMTKVEPTPTFEGELVHKDGMKEKIVLMLFKD